MLIVNSFVFITYVFFSLPVIVVCIYSWSLMQFASIFGLLAILPSLAYRPRDADIDDIHVLLCVCHECNECHVSISSGIIMVSAVIQ